MAGTAQSSTAVTMLALITHHGLTEDIRCPVQMYATAGSDTVVRVYDDHQRAPLLSLSGGDGTSCCGHTNTVFGLCWKPEDSQVSPTYL